MRMLLLIALLPVLAATLMPERENIFAAGMLNFSSFRATVLFSTRTHLIAITTGRHTGGDVSARVRATKEMLDGMACTMAKCVTVSLVFFLGDLSRIASADVRSLLRPTLLQNVVVRTSTKGGAFGTWTPPRIIATVSAPTLEANGGL